MKIKRSIIIPSILIIYLVVMAFIGWPSYAQEGKYLEFTLIIVATLVIIVVLFFLLRRRDRMRQSLRKRRDKK
jgi:hypothetical protein